MAAKRILTALYAGFFRLYYRVKYLPFGVPASQKGGAREPRGFVAIQVDGLSHAVLREAMRAKRVPRLRRMVRRRRARLLRYPAGLPSCTTYAQAGIMFGWNDDIPGFRWLEKESGLLVSCDRIASVQYLREKIGHDRVGILEGGSSHANLLEGDAAHVTFTPGSARPRSLLSGMGLGRFLLLLLLHPIRTLRLLAFCLVELTTECSDRYHARRADQATVREGWFPLVRVFCSAILLEAETLAVLVDIYLGVPYIYATYGGYDISAHHYGPTARPAFRALRQIDRRIGEIERAIWRSVPRRYDLIVLSDHGQTPAIPFQKEFGATLGEAAEKALAQYRHTSRAGARARLTNASARGVWHELERGQETGRGLLPPVFGRAARRLEELLDVEWLRPGSLAVDPEIDLVVACSSALAHVYFPSDRKPLDYERISKRHPEALRFFEQHEGIGVVLARSRDGGVCVTGRGGRARIRDGRLKVETKPNPLARYRTDMVARRAIERLLSFPSSGDLVLFGRYDGKRIVCFDDQVGAHEALGGDQFDPFLLLPRALSLKTKLTDPRDLYDQVFIKCRQRREGGEQWISD